jgi:hypothetical protein
LGSELCSRKAAVTPKISESAHATGRALTKTSGNVELQRLVGKLSFVRWLGRLLGVDNNDFP